MALLFAWIKPCVCACESWARSTSALRRCVCVCARAVLSRAHAVLFRARSRALALSLSGSRERQVDTYEHIKARACAHTHTRKHTQVLNDMGVAHQRLGDLEIALSIFKQVVSARLCPRVAEYPRFVRCGLERESVLNQSAAALKHPAAAL